MVERTHGEGRRSGGCDEGVGGWIMLRVERTGEVDQKSQKTTALNRGCIEIE